MLSIISICYNNLAGLKKTLQIFEEKQFQNIEIVVVDGGSKDGTLDYLNSQTICKNFVSEPDKGIYNAMNKGMKMANGDYFWFLNSGDFAHSEKVIHEILELLKTNPDVVYGETILVKSNYEIVGKRSEISKKKLPENLNWKSLKQGMSVGHQSFIIKKEKCLQYDEWLKYVSDIDWMIRCLKGCKTCLQTKAPIANFSLDGFSSQKRKESNKERFFVLQKHYGFISNLWHHLQILIRAKFG